MESVASRRRGGARLRAHGLIGGRVPLILAGILALGALVRFAGLGHQSFGHDEAVTVGQVLHPGLAATLRQVPRTERTPYLYYLLAWLWTRVFGTGAAGIRSLSAVFGVMTIPAAFAAARLAASERAGLIAAALVAVDPFLVYYSQEARSYALFALLTAGSLWALMAVLRRPSPRALVAWSVCGTLAILTHYFAFFLLAAEAICLLAAAGPRRWILAAAAPIAVAGGALLGLLIDQAGRHPGATEMTALWRRLPTVLVQFMFGERLSIRGLYTATPALGYATLLTMVGLTWLVWRSRQRLLLASALVGFAVLLVPFALDLAGLQYFNARNCISALLALLVLLAGFLSSSRRGYAVAILLGVLGLVMSVALAAVPALQRPDYRGADALLGGGLRGHRALVISAGGDAPTLLYRAAHDPQPWPRAGARVAEIDVLGADDAPPGAPPPAGFRTVERRDAGTVRVTRLLSGTPRVVSRQELVALSPGGPSQRATTAVLLERRG